MTRRLAVGLLASALAASSTGLGLSSVPSAQAAVRSGFVTLPSSTSPTLPPRSSLLGALSPTARLQVEIALKLPRPAAVRSFIAALSDRSSPEFHHFLRPGQFGPRFGPSMSEVASVEAALRSEGLHPGAVSSDRLLVAVSAPASVIDRAFRVQLSRYRLASGRVVYSTASAPSVPASVSPFIEGVVGLSDLLQPHDNLVRARSTPARLQVRALTPRSAGPVPCSAASMVASADGSYTADELAAYYDMDPLYSLGDFGQQVRVAIAEFEPDSPADIAAYQACYGTNATVNYIDVDGGAPPGYGSDAEAAMDIEDVIGLAPEASIDVYQAPSSSNADVIALYSEIVDNDTEPVVSTSWGECEPDQDASDSSFRVAEQGLFEQAATQGQSVFAAAGDTGSTDCYGDPGSSNQQSLYVDDPASQPYVVGVGGTSIVGGTETVWNDASGASGGGSSYSWCMPSYQDQTAIQGLISSYSDSAANVAGTTCAPGAYMREVPDVTADADPDSGYVIYWKNAWTGDNGGTSAGAPLWAAAAALIDASPFCSAYGSGDAGVQPTGLYQIAALGSAYYGLAFKDITTGNNDYSTSGYVDGLYPATVGYDMASGLGSPRLAYSGNYYPGLAAQMCIDYRTQLVTTKITGVSPDAGPSGQPTTVTISGSGFLPIAGADRIQMGSDSVDASCASTTTCTATLPATGAGTFDLVMSVEDTTLSATTASDRFTFADPPTITRISPSRGPEKGGTKVTVDGSNFFGTVAVRFGGNAATNVHVISPSEITLNAPIGSGLARVVVTADAGETPTSPDALYTYLAPPTVSGITPATGPNKGGTEVTIRGKNFVAPVSVLFGSRRARAVHVVSASKIVASVPAGSGAAPVTVTALGGSSRIGISARFTFLAPPSVIWVSPSRGLAGGGTKVTIWGRHFVAPLSVRFGRKPAGHVHVLSSSRITVTAPSGTGTVHVVVSTVGGISKQVAATEYRY